MFLAEARSAMSPYETKVLNNRKKKLKKAVDSAVREATRTFHVHLKAKRNAENLLGKLHEAETGVK